MDALTLAQQILAVIDQVDVDPSRRYLALDIARQLLTDRNYEPAKPYVESRPDWIARSKSA